MSEQTLSDKVDQLIRPGKVVKRQPDMHRVQVELADTPGGAMVTDWLPCVVPCGFDDCDYHLPDIGAYVVCIFRGNGMSDGFVLGCYYGGNKPPVTSGEKWHHKFKDGTFIEYDREEHKLTANVQGDIEAIATGNVTINTQGNETKTTQGNVSNSSQGSNSMSSQAGINLNAPSIAMGGAGGGATSGLINGNLRVTGDVIVNGISFLGHVHDKVTTGGDLSGVPVGG